VNEVSELFSLDNARCRLEGLIRLLKDYDAKNVADLVLRILDALLRIAEGSSTMDAERQYIREKAEAILRFVG